MTENIPPSSAGKPAVGTESTNRGLPYYEKLRRDLRDTLQKKRILDKNMATLEETIYRHETAYLEETTPAGNIIKGFDNYIKASASLLATNNNNNNNNNIASSSTSGPGVGGGTISGSAAGGGGGPATARRKTVINEMDRVFSRSSTSYMRDSDSPSSATTTPGHGGVGTPTGVFAAGGAQSQGSSAAASLKGGGGKKNKKKKKKGDVEDEGESEADGKPNKRARISYGPRE